MHGQVGFLLGYSLAHVGTSSTYGVVGVCKDRVWVWVVGVGGVVVGVVFWNLGARAGAGVQSFPLHGVV